MSRENVEIVRRVHGDQVLAVVTRRARGRASGADVEWRLALVWTLRAGKVVRLAWFPSREEAAGAIAAPGANRG
jgi:ketosteroid isomerase-like protein